MKDNRIIFCCATALIAASTSSATVWKVRERFTWIQDAINFDSVATGDTISVWGLPTETPPFYFYETLNFRGKGLTVINRSFIPGQVPYDPSWEHVIIDGQRQGHVVYMYSSAPAKLEGFTITGGYDSFGGGVCCHSPSAQIVHNRITANEACGYLAGGGGGLLVFPTSATDTIQVMDNRIDHNNSRQPGGGALIVFTGSNPEPGFALSFCRNNRQQRGPFELRFSAVP